MGDGLTEPAVRPYARSLTRGQKINAHWEGWFLGRISRLLAYSSQRLCSTFLADTDGVATDHGRALIFFLATCQISSIGAHSWFGEPVTHIIFFPIGYSHRFKFQIIRFFWLYIVTP